MFAPGFQKGVAPQPAAIEDPKIAAQQQPARCESATKYPAADRAATPLKPSPTPPPPDRVYCEQPRSPLSPAQSRCSDMLPEYSARKPTDTAADLLTMTLPRPDCGSGCRVTPPPLSADGCRSGQAEWRRAVCEAPITEHVPVRPACVTPSNMTPDRAGSRPPADGPCETRRSAASGRSPPGAGSPSPRRPADDMCAL